MAEHTHRQRWFGAAAAAAAVGLVVLAIRLAQSDADDAGTPLGKSFQYDLGELTQVDPALMIARELDPISVSLPEPRALAAGADGRLYVGGAGAVAILGSDGTVAATLSVTGAVRCVAVDEEGGVYAGVGNRVACWPAAGGTNAARPLLWEAVTNGVFTGIAVHDSGIYVADAGNRVLWRYEPSGRRLAGIGPRRQDGSPGFEFIVPSPYFDVAVAPDGSLWAVDPGRHELRNYRPDGRVAASWSKSAMGLEGFCGCCNPGAIAIMADGSFVTGEKGIVRVKLYGPQGDFKGVIAAPAAFAPDTRGLDLAVDARGRVLVLDPERRQVRVFERNR
jgi:sugar lactone lactonase YvrE